MTPQIDTTHLIERLVELLNIPSPTGYHDEAMAYLLETLEELPIPGLQVSQTVKGAVVARVPGRAASPPRALSAHVDTLGAMVRAVKSNGRLLVTQLGSYAWNSVENENVTIHSVNTRRRFRGTIQTVTPSVHTSSQAREGKREEERMEVRIDARTAKKEETLALGIDVGDFVFLDPRVEQTDTGYIKSRHLDDKAGVAILLVVLQQLARQELRPLRDTVFFFSNYEEVGHGASAGLPADLAEMLVIDMAASTTGEHQNSDEYSVGICAKDTTGPYDVALRRNLVALAKAQQIPYKIDTYPSYGSDGSAYLRAGGNVRVGLIGPGVDASHAYERTHRDSLEATACLALSYVLGQDETEEAGTERK